MIITQTSLMPYDIPYRRQSTWRPLDCARRQGFLVVIRTEDGRIGVGETAPLVLFSRETLPEVPGLTRTALDRLPGTRVPLDFRALTDRMERIDRDQHSRSKHLPPSARFGIETALGDLASKAAGLPLARWLNPDARTSVPVNAVITGGPEDLETEIIEKQKAGFRTYKIKVGRSRPEEDLRMVATARKMLGEGAAIRIDANRAWNFEEALEALNRLRPYRIEYVEEPLQGPLIHRLPELHERSGIDIAVDESTREEIHHWKLLENPAVHTVIIKPSIVGGIEKSLEMSREVSRHGKRFTFTSLFETGIGLTACLHTAAAAADEISPCGFDTLGFLSDSLIHEPLRVRDGSMEVPGDGGLGVTPKKGCLPA